MAPNRPCEALAGGGKARIPDPWAVFWPADTHLGAQLAWLPIPIKEPPQGRILPNYSLNLIDVRISY